MNGMKMPHKWPTRREEHSPRSSARGSILTMLIIYCILTAFWSAVGADNSCHWSATHEESVEILTLQIIKQDWISKGVKKFGRT